MFEAILGSKQFEDVEFGAIQKLINMTLKYIIILNLFDEDFKKNGFNVDIENCDCPLDSTILSRINRKDVKWTQINDSLYKDVQDKISECVKTKYNAKGNMIFDFKEYL